MRGKQNNVKNDVRKTSLHRCLILALSLRYSGDFELSTSLYST